jgi:ATP-dependent helicase/nuclease subunit A
VSTWISASAGTGKTKNLVARIVALLLNGVTPSKILCLTYTKAAAIEMSTRLSDYLQKLSKISNEELKSELDVFGYEKSFGSIARSLYEKCIMDSSVIIQTIHSFCFKLFERFPLETGLYPGIELCDANQRKQLMEKSINYVLAQKHSNLELISDYTLDIFDILESHAMDISHFIDKFKDFKNLYASLFNVEPKWLNLRNEEIDALLFEKLFSSNQAEVFNELAEVLFSGSISDQKKAEILKRNAIHPTEEFTTAFLTEKDNLLERKCTRKIMIQGFSARMCDTEEKALQFRQIKKRIISARENSAFFMTTEKIIRKFRELKASNQYLDYDDVILRAVDLLKNIDGVIYKLDEGVDHILVDEAQDTSPEQWEIIQAISEGFFPNYQLNKTIFVVGDEKQSIYSFQGADVKLFSKMRNYFKTNTERSGRKFHDILLNKSYRTSGNILSFLDEVFAEKFTNISHLTNRNPDAGVVEIVDLFEDDESNQANEKKQLCAGEKLSSYIANLIENAIKTGVFVESKNRTAEASDFLILFQRRQMSTMWSIIDALKKKNIYVTGIDEIRLSEELVVEDLIAVAEFAVFPLDDLMCARVLRSPIIDLSEDDLQAICLARKDRNLWNYVRENFSLERLQNYINLSSQISVYDFFMYILLDGAKEKLISRLGEKCLDILNEFLALVIDYEKKNTPSVQSFLEWFRYFDPKIKRESDSNQNAVRLMTVHASKGLQSPFVILADAHFRNESIEPLLKTKEGLLFWNFSPEFRPPEIDKLIEERRSERLEEFYRLLYVAMTRAEDFLYILGEKHKKSLQEKCWYNFVRKKLNKFRRIESEHLYRLGDYTHINTGTKEVVSVVNPTAEIPPWYYEKLPFPIENSHQFQQKDFSAIYGDSVHLLLTEMPPYRGCDLYDEIADQFMENFDLAATEKEKAKEESWRVMEKFDFLFDSRSQAEVSFVYEGTVGRIDKIAFRGEELWIVDFKTGVPREEIPSDYIAQLKLYKKAITKITGSSFARTAILWTRSLDLVEIDFSAPK